MGQLQNLLCLVLRWHVLLGPQSFDSAAIYDHGGVA